MDIWLLAALGFLNLSPRLPLLMRVVQGNA